MLDALVEEVFIRGSDELEDGLERHPIRVIGNQKIGFSIKLEGDESDILNDYEGLRTRLEEYASALQEHLPGAIVKKLEEGCILVTCEWPSRGAWELPLAVRQALSDPTFKLAGYPLLFEDGAPSLKVEYFKVQLRASLECLQLLG